MTAPARRPLVLLLLLVGCAPMTARLPPDRLPTKGGDGPGYRFQNLAGGPDDPEFTAENQLFVCLSFSGGGTRAAALAYGAMLALHQAHIDWPRPGETLLDEVDCISSVSGGSFTAAYYGLFRNDLFEHFADRFLYRKVQTRLVLGALNPLNWPRLWSPYFSRIDLAAELYDGLFRHATFGDLVKDGRRPFVILNATNIATGTRFPFTQDQFDLIGSDLGPYHVARGVAASSAFPFLLSPVTLENHQPLEHFPRLTEYERGLEGYYTNRSRFFWSRSQLDYVERPHPYVHLMDGGLADNIGLRSLVNAYQQANGFIARNTRTIDRLAIIAVNARTESEDRIGDHRHTPHIVPTVSMATATIAMDNYTFDTVDLTSRLTDDLRQAKLEAAQHPGPFPFHAPVPYVSEISFEAIHDEHERDAFLGMATSFELPGKQVRALIAKGCELLKNDPKFRCLLADIEREASGHHESESVCDGGSGDVHPQAIDGIHCPDAGSWPARR